MRRAAELRGQWLPMLVLLALAVAAGDDACALV